MISVFPMSGSNDYVMPADTGTRFRIDATCCQYVYNLDARTLGSGKYQMRGASK